MQKAVVVLAFISFCHAMPMLGNRYISTNLIRIRPQCLDSNNNRYDIGRNFRRQFDGYICNCTYQEEYLRTRLYCRSPPRHSSNSVFGGNAYYPFSYDERERSILNDYCLYRRRDAHTQSQQNIFFQLNTERTLVDNGVTMNCVCSAEARLTCRSAGQIPSLPSADSADSSCQRRDFVRDEEFAVLQPGDYYSICTCQTSTEATCRVPTMSGRSCQFPFSLSGNYYSTCTSSSTRSAPFCLTGNRRASNCLTSLQEITTYNGLIFTYGGNANGAACHFPFTTNGIEYQRCTTAERGVMWCATTSNYESDRRYGYCRLSSISDSGNNNGGSVFKTVGQPAIIECLFQRPPGVQNPTITWYKLTENNGRQKLYTYNSEDATGEEAPTAGQYRGRLSMPNERQLVINDIRLNDGGTFECQVHYVGNTEIQVRTDVSISEAIESPGSLTYKYYPRVGQIRFEWINPSSDYDSIRLEYQEVGGNVIRRVTLPANRNSFRLNGLRPGSTYQVRVYTMRSGVKSAPLPFNITVPTTTSVGRPTEETNEGVPSATQPLVSRHITTDSFTLNWFPDLFENLNVGGWKIVYIDTSTGISQNVTLASTKNTFVLSGLRSGQQYRVRLYAIVDENNLVEVDTKNISTEEEEEEIELSLPTTSKSTLTTITVSWEPPSSGNVTSYEISYRAQSDSSSQWITYNEPATITPQTTIRNLMVGTRYDIHITPLSGLERGEVYPFVASTLNVPPSIETPQNLRLSDITRSSFLAQWLPVGGARNVRYRVRYYPSDRSSQAIEYMVSRTEFRALGLFPNKKYVFEVTALTDSGESSEASANVTTVNEVCLVNNIWRRHQEKFYKMNAQGYLQNCTCHKTESGSRWECEPIICRSTNGGSYFVDQSWQQEHETGDYLEDCTCTRIGKQCQYASPITRPQATAKGILGATMTLQCIFDESLASQPTITWYKLTNDGKVPLYIYDGQTGSSTPQVEAGQLYGRMSLRRNGVDFVISSLSASDSGTYQCAVQYPRSENPTFYRTGLRVNPPQQPVALALPSAPETYESSSNSINLRWESPGGRATGYLIKYRGENDESEQTVRVTSESIRLINLEPATSYRVTVIPLINNLLGVPSTVLTRTSDRVDENTVTPETPAVPEPTNLRFDRVTSSSLRALWDIPYSVIPIDGYRLQYKSRDSEDEPVSVNTTSRSYVFNELQPGTSYVISAFAVKNSLESEPITREVTTRRIGLFRVYASSNRRSYYLGGTAILNCNFDLNLPGKPIVTWYRVISSSDTQELATFNESSDEDEQFTISEMAGTYSDRLEAETSGSLTITNLMSSDHGTYECRVHYPTGNGKGRTSVEIVGNPVPAVFTSSSNSSEEREHILTWSVEPAPRIDGFSLNIRRQGARRYTKFRLPGDTRTFRFRNLRPGRIYEGYMTSYNQYGSSAPARFTFTMATSRQPDIPTTIQVIEAQPNQITLQPSGAAGVVQFYRIRYHPVVPVEGVSERVAEGTQPDEPVNITNLIPNTSYRLEVTAVNSFGESDVLRGIVKTPAQLPEAPTNVIVQKLSPREIFLTVEGPRDHVDYYEVVYRNADGSQPDQVLNTVRDQSNFTLDVRPDTNYVIVVKGVNQEGSSSGLRLTLSTPPEILPPPPPTSVSSIQPFTNKVIFEWSGDISNVQYYAIEYWIEGESERQVGNTYGPLQRAVISGLQPSTTYNYAIKSVGRGGESASINGQFTTEQAAQPPNNAVIDETTHNEVTFNIEGVSNADYYIINYNPVNRFDQQMEIRSYTGEVTLSNLRPSTTYRVTIITVLGNDRSEPLEKLFTTHEQPPATPVSAPKGFMVSARQSNQAQVEWLPTAGADFYTVEYKTTFSQSSPTTFIVYPPNTNTLLRNLIPGTEYEVRVYATGGGHRSEEAIVTFVSRLDSPRNLRFREENDHLVISWDNPIGPRDGIRMFYRRGNVERSVLLQSTASEYTIPLLISEGYNQPIHIEVTAVNVNTESNPTSIDITLRQPEFIPLTGVYLDNVSDKQADVVFEITSNIPRNGWTLTLIDNNEIVEGPVSLSNDAESYHLANLLPGHRYITSLKDSNGNELSRNEFMTKVSKPRNVQYLEVNHNNASISWEPPGGNLNGYLIKYKTSSASSWIEQQIANLENPQVRIMNLEPETSYILEIIPLYTDTVMQRPETGIPSFQIFRTPAEPEDEQLRPMPVRSILVSEITGRSAAVSWDATESDVNLYRVVLRRADNERLITTKNVRGSTNFYVTSLLPNTLYALDIYSVRGIRESEPASTNFSTVSEYQPPEMNVEDVQGSSFTVVWAPFTIGATRYIVTAQKSDSSDQPLVQIASSNANSQSFNGLHPATAYDVTLRAVINGRETTPVEMIVTTDLPRPENVQIRETTSDSISLEWEQPNEEIQNYLVFYRPYTNYDSYQVFVNDTTDVVLENLIPETAYSISVHSIYNNARSEPSSITSSTLPARETLTAPADVNISLEPRAGTMEYLVSWEPIEGYNGTFVVEYHPNDANQIRQEVTRPGESFLRLSDLLPGINYVVNIYPSSSNTPESTSTASRLIPVPAPEDVNVESIGTNQATVTFSATDYDTVGRYEVRLYPISRFDEVTEHTLTPADNKRVLFQDLEPNTEYKVEVITHAGVTTSPIAETIFATEPEEPLRPEVTDEPPKKIEYYEIERGTYRIRWQAADQPVSYYRIIFKRKYSNTTTQQIVPGNTQETLLTDLTPGESYVVWVVAVMEDEQEEDERELIDSITIETASGEHSTDRSAFIKWNEVPDDYVRYRVTATPLENEEERFREWFLAGTDTNIKLTGLYPGTRYSVVVEGYTRNGETRMVLNTTVTTDVDTPINFQVTKSSPTTLTLEWTKPLARIDSYTLTYQAEGGEETTSIPSPAISSQRHTLTNLLPGHRYTVRLYATSLAVQEDSSPAELFGETPVPHPLKFHAPQVTPNLIGLSWEKPHDEVTHYTLRVVNKNNNNMVISDEMIGADSTTFIVRNLQPDTPYQLYLVAWVNNSHSRAVTRRIATRNQLGQAKLVKTPVSDDGDGVVLNWKGKSRTVEGWLIVVEPDDGSEVRQIRVDRFTKRYKLENLRPGVSYVVKVSPYSGDSIGRESVIKIPASKTRLLTSRAYWQLLIPTIESNSVTLQWNTPQFGTPVEDYQLMIKLQDEPDSQFRLTPVQPQAGDNSITINNLEPGQSYSIKLKAYHSGSEEDSNRMTLTLLANVTTPFPPPSEVQMELLPNGSYVFSWQHGSLPITAYVLQYRLAGARDQEDYHTIRLQNTATSVTLDSLETGNSYEVSIFAEKGRIQSTAVIFSIDVLNPGCRDDESGIIYQVNEHWITEQNGFRLNCSCNGPQTYYCDTGDWCHVDGVIYDAGETWRNHYEETNKKEICICNGKSGYMCYPRNCQENGYWYDVGTSWQSRLDGLTCTCSCPEDITQVCLTRCV